MENSTGIQRMDRASMYNFDEVFYNDLVGFELSVDILIYFNYIAQAKLVNLFGEFEIDRADFLRFTQRTNSSLFFTRSKADLGNILLPTGEEVPIRNKFESVLVSLAKTQIDLSKIYQRADKKIVSIASESLIKLDIHIGARDQRKYTIRMNSAFVNGILKEYSAINPQGFFNIRGHHTSLYPLKFRLIKLYNDFLRNPNTVIQLYYPEMKKLTGINITARTNRANIKQTIAKMNAMVNKIKEKTSLDFDYMVNSNNAYVFIFRKTKYYLEPQRHERLFNNAVRVMFYDVLRHSGCDGVSGLSTEEVKEFVEAAFKANYENYIVDPNYVPSLVSAIASCLEGRFSYDDVYKIAFPHIK